MDRIPLTRGPGGAALAVGLLVGISLLVGCSSEPAFDHPYADRYAEALSQATSDFERAVLADGTITRAEYEEAVSRYADCMDGAGFPVTLVEQHGYYVYDFSAAPGLDAADERCAEGNTFIVAGLYADQLTNPGADDWDTLRVRCFIHVDLVDDEYTPEQFMIDATDQTLPFDDTSPAFDLCMANPSRGLGAS